MIHESFSDESEDEGYSQLVRAAAASRCTWVSVIVNITLSLTQIAVGVLSKSQGLVSPKKSSPACWLPMPGMRAPTPRPLWWLA
jgi:hypothetical protein